MKKDIFLAVIILSAVLLLCSCGKVKDHDTLISEIAASNQKKHNKRAEFMNSDAYTIAAADIEDAMNNYCTCKWEYSIEPGNYYNSDLPSSDETRISFFQSAALTITVHDREYDCLSLAEQLASDGFTGTIYVANTDDSYEFDGATKEAKYMPIPEV